MKQYYVYILCCRDGSYYTGITNDVENRVIHHQRGDDPKSYTYMRRPVKLVFVEEFREVNDAIAAEKQIKGWSRKKKEALMKNNIPLLEQLSKRHSNVFHHIHPS